MSVWLVVPVRSFRDGKRRLAPALDAARRAELVEWLLVRTLEQAAEFPGLKRTLVATACHEARACASSRGVRVLEDGGAGGLNGALAQARTAVTALAASRMLVASSDLPLLTAQDLLDCSKAASATAIAIAPDRARQGTNGLCLPTSCAFEFSFGPSSFARHVDQARRLHMEAAVIERAGFAFDVDLPTDLSELDTILHASLGPHL